jgi:tRNA threonylcarbamoyladenosine biosynthesis protein TsaE
MDELYMSHPGEIPSAAGSLLKTFKDNRVFAFYGEMGVGKTTFIKALCTVLKVSDLVSSPSFGLLYEYRRKVEQAVYHFDFFRIEKVEEILDLGYEEYFFSGCYCFIEWPEFAEELLPADAIRLHMRENSDHSRTITRIG